MPYSSGKQANFMQAVAHSPKFAKKVGVPVEVGQKFEDHRDYQRDPAPARGGRDMGKARAKELRRRI
jgi:hypothetical protein